MKLQPVSQELLPKVVRAMAQCPLFKGIDDRHLSSVAQQAVLLHCTPGEVLLKQGDAADTLLVMLNGQAVQMMTVPVLPEPIEVGRVRAMQTWGEVTLLLKEPYRCSLVAVENVLALRLTQAVVDMLYERVPSFGPALGRHLARRIRQAEPPVPLAFFDVERNPPSDDIIKLLPVQFITRQRVLPVRSEGSKLYVGFVDDLTERGIKSVQQNCPGMDIAPVHIDAEAFNRIMRSKGGAMDLSSGAYTPTNTPTGPYAPVAHASPAVGVSVSPDAGASGDPVARLAPRLYGPRMMNNPKLDALLKRMVAEGASDLHLSAHHKPRWRIDGEILEISEAKVLGPDTVYKLFEPVMADRSIFDFQNNDADFAYAVEKVARFRVNLFRDRHGVCSVLRQIPDKILTFQQLGLPDTVRRMCDHPKGLVLVTGPTGSGKSTTLAAMVDYINKNRRTHIITLEDPIEFVHKSRKALVNQREIVEHTESFARALKSALREDPDIVLVGEMRDLETVALALETANTGHLVFGTLHTATAISTVDRIIDLFPHEQQPQVRAVVADTLKGVISQTLLRKKGGGRIAALEIMVGSAALANLIREGKNHQIANIMMTAKNQGNQMLNEELQALVQEGKVDFEEALAKALDKPDLAKRFGREYFES